MSYRKRKIINNLMLFLSTLSFFVGALFLFWILGDIFIKGISKLNLRLIIDLPKPPGVPGGGVANAIIGTMLLSLIASIIGIPIGILSGIYIAEYGNNRFAWWTRYISEVLSSIPTIIIGIFIYIVIVVPMKRFSAIAGGVALGIIMIPTIVKATEESLKMIPNTVREAGYALGAPKWRVIIKVVLPSASSGIITGIMSSLARIMGETAPLLFTSLNNNFLSLRLDQPIASLTVTIFNYATSPYKEWKDIAWASSFLLAMIILLLNILSRYYGKRRYHQ
ncbi:MAG: phosphate ABC transporter, permease protein PstA [Dictyoglomus sp. NZ13-RE01]|nr:MAG: phosphate ABC transporter, permease protein PstA [Dictyoglomus sp. NZ13-RE01]